MSNIFAKLIRFFYKKKEVKKLEEEPLVEVKFCFFTDDDIEVECTWQNETDTTKQGLSQLMCYIHKGLLVKECVSIIKDNSTPEFYNYVFALWHALNSEVKRNKNKYSDEPLISPSNVFKQQVVKE